MIPKYSNPSTLLSSTAIVSRAALRDDSDDEAEPAQTNPEHAQLVARLENILKRSIDETLPHKDGAGDGELPRKKKRRRVDKGGQEDDPVQDAAVQEEVTIRASCLMFTLSVGALTRCAYCSVPAAFWLIAAQTDRPCTQGPTKDHVGVSHATVSVTSISDCELVRTVPRQRTLRQRRSGEQRVRAKLPSTLLGSQRNPAR